MTLYNIIGASTFADGQAEDPSQILANLEAIQAILNGEITDDNIASNAAIQGSKILGRTGLFNPSGFSHVAYADVPYLATCDGGTTFAPVAKAAPPSWLNAGGEIIAPGLYELGALITISVAPTSPGVALLRGNRFTAGNRVCSIDLINHAGGWADTFSEVASLLAADLPFDTTSQFVGVVDATCVVSVLPYIQQLASS